MKFTQFMFPDGRRNAESIDRPPEIERLADELMAAGWSFEIECHPDTQLVHMDCCDDDRAISNRICRNGPQVPVKVDELVTEAHGAWVNEGRPAAVGSRLERTV